jgi:hypothetical protein
MSKNNRIGLDNRHRDQNGEIRHKNGTTLVRTLRETYGENVAAGVRADMKLDTLLSRTGSPPLSQYLKGRQSRRRPAAASGRRRQSTQAGGLN